MKNILNFLLFDQCVYKTNVCNEVFCSRCLDVSSFQIKMYRCPYRKIFLPTVQLCLISAEESFNLFFSYTCA